MRLSASVTKTGCLVGFCSVSGGDAAAAAACIQVGSTPVSTSAEDICGTIPVFGSAKAVSVYLVWCRCGLLGYTSRGIQLSRLSAMVCPDVLSLICKAMVACWVMSCVLRLDSQPNRQG